MKSDSIFYRLFKTFPGTFFELINQPASQAQLYEFSSVEVKQTAFRLDGLFLPQQKDLSFPIYFLEVQFQKDEEFYQRLFSEIFLYLRYESRNQPWHAVIVFARRSLEPQKIESYRVLLETSLVTRLYLNELGNIEELPLGIALMKLIIERKRGTTTTAKKLIERTRSEIRDTQEQQNVLELIETIILYKLPLISRQELGKMFSTFDIKKTRYYRELREEMIPELREELRPELREELRPELREEMIPELREELRPELQEELRPKIQEELRPKIREELRQELEQQVQQQVHQEKTLEIALKLLRHRFISLTPVQETQLKQLSIEQLDNLMEVILDFQEISDFATWLQTQRGETST